MWKALRISLFSIWILTALVWATAQADAPQVYVLKAKGTINPVLAGYIDRGIGIAESRDAAVLVIQLDTPGGLDSSMREIAQRIINSRVPVVVYVSPAGARAASAGVFITLAAHVAAMAPNTAIGAAHPVTIGSTGGAEDLPSDIEKKVVNDAVAYIKGLAQRQGRNAEWAEQAVRESVSITDQEALELNVIDLVATDLPALISQLDGREANLLTGAVTLQTRGATVVNIDMTLVESFLFALSDPNIAYILLSLAMTGLFLELANPGSILPGIVGGIFLLLALYSLGTLPVNWAGVLLIGFAFILFIAEILVVSHGMLTIGGIASLTIGSFILMSSNASFFTIDRRLIAAVVIAITAFFVFVVNAVIRAHRRRPSTGKEGMVGKIGVARTRLNPMGTVFVNGERWTAYSEEGAVKAGEDVIVTRVDKLKMWVTKSKK